MLINGLMSASDVFSSSGDGKAGDGVNEMELVMDAVDAKTKGKGKE